MQLQRKQSIIIRDSHSPNYPTITIQMISPPLLELHLDTFPIYQTAKSIYRKKQQTQGAAYKSREDWAIPDNQDVRDRNGRWKNKEVAVW